MLRSAETEVSCFHCGDPLPPGKSYTATIADVEQPMCCPGCQAVATLIAGAGLESFYRLRTDVNERAPELPEANPYLPYDLEENYQDFVEVLPNGTRRAQLLIGGISCAACTWLIESALLREAGIRKADVNLARQSLGVEWDAASLPLSEIFQRLLSLGYDPHPWQANAGAELLQAEQKKSLRELAVAGLAMMQVGMFAIALHAGDIQGIASEYRDLMRWVSLIIATLVVTYSARSFFRNAWVNLVHRRLVMDLPVALAIGLAYLASTWGTLTSSGQVYFDSISMFTFFLLLGRHLERRVRQREFLRQTDLQSLLPVASLRREGNDWISVPTGSVRCGDTLLLRAGDVITADGRITTGAGSVDEAAFSGEHLLRSLSAGDRVSAGTVLKEGSAEMEVLADAASSRLSGMLGMMSRAVDGKPRLSKLADRVAAWFVGAILIIASCVAAWWWQSDPEQVLWVTLSVLVVSCPCALALATPTALTAATSRLRSAGLLLVGENSLETLSRSGRIIFDKTGTLTSGELRRRAVVTGADISEGSAMSVAAALEQQVNHPLAEAFSDVQPEVGISTVESVAGQGVKGLWQGRQVAIGRPEFAASFCRQSLQPPDPSGHWIALVDEQSLLAWVAVEDSLRPEAAEVVSALKARGLAVEMLTGDSSDAGPRLARELDIEELTTGATPADKLERIRSLQADGEIVVMVGDGLNDAPVLAAADCSIAVNQATDLAKSRADGILLNPSIRPVLMAFQTAARSNRIIRQNMAWAISYNGLAVPLAAAGLVPPWLAAIGMSASSLLVVLNSLRLK